MLRSGFRMGRLSATEPSKSHAQCRGAGRRGRVRALTIGGVAILAVASQLLISPVANGETIEAVPSSGAASLPQQTVPVDEPLSPGLVPGLPPGLVPAPPGVIPGLPPGLVPVPPDLPTACADPGDNSLFRFELCLAQPRPLEMFSRLEVRTNVLPVSLSVSDTRSLSPQSIAGACLVAFGVPIPVAPSPPGPSGALTQADPGGALTQSDSDPDGTANTSRADGIAPIGFNEATYLSPLPADGGPPAVGAGLAAAAAPVGHTDTKNVITRQETDSDAHASPLGIALPIGLHS